MKVPPSSLSSDLMPFFQRDYVKANSDDVMRAFPRMLTDMALTLPTEVCPWGEWGGEGVGVWRSGVERVGVCGGSGCGEGVGVWRK